MRRVSLQSVLLFRCPHCRTISRAPVERISEGHPLHETLCRQFDALEDWQGVDPDATFASTPPTVTCRKCKAELAVRPPKELLSDCDAIEFELPDQPEEDTNS